MYDLTREHLYSIYPFSKDAVDLYFPYFERYLPEYQIDTPARLWMFFAQIGVESSHLKRVEENLNYTTPSRMIEIFPRYFNWGNVYDYVGKPEKIGSRVYANRMGNGNEASGDGYKYRGRGLIQLTGKNNYTAASAGLGIDFVNNPDLLGKKYPENCVLASLWFWDTNGLNSIADTENVERATRVVNGGQHAIIQRKELYNIAKSIIV
jgi:putative chitinase